MHIYIYGSFLVILAISMEDLISISIDLSQFVDHKNEKRYYCEIKYIYKLYTIVYNCIQLYLTYCLQHISTYCF